MITNHYETNNILDQPKIKDDSKNTREVNMEKFAPNLKPHQPDVSKLPTKVDKVVEIRFPNNSKFRISY